MAKLNRFYYETLDTRKNHTYGYLNENSNDEAIMRFAHDIENGCLIYLINTSSEEILLDTLPVNSSKKESN